MTEPRPITVGGGVDDDGRALAPGSTHDPDGADLGGWAAADFTPDDYATPDEVDALAVDVADGTQDDSPDDSPAVP